MKAQKLERRQLIKADIETTWEFFSNPSNLSVITPPHLDFEITSTFPKKYMYPGQIITYKVKPLLGIPLNWMTEITQVEKPYFFIDEQRIGPYKLWHHQHHFDSVEDGTMMTDIVHYQISNWLLGGLSDLLIVKKQLRDIFDFRLDKVEEIFNSKN